MIKGLAFDPATNTGWAAGTDRTQEDWEFGHFKMPKRDVLGERLVILGDNVDALIVKHAPDLIFAEEPFTPWESKEGDTRPRISGATINFLQFVKSIIHERAARHGVPLEAYAAATWRVTALGFGRAAGVNLKEAMWQRARMLKWACETEDEADAGGILMHGLHGPDASARKQTSLLEAFGKRL